jgi:hypothetical protein
MLDIVIGVGGIVIIFIIACTFTKSKKAIMSNSIMANHLRMLAITILCC